ncbi:hypothetical protein O181_065821 [Austropuccinia psidii MF-1]|uniref:Reverse transcriptase domain-containing protein n=1 Tax=Austropuccinia psidii MF-1 TaxID=1389203 RepID=A0A9Q3I1K2_9BASI|nr:hypothetical protein [Austropuccinia psidii MF-1]
MGIYEYTRVPIGIRNAPAHFKRMMDRMFQEEILECGVVVYTDDIIVYSETWEDHMKYIDRVLSFQITKESRDAYERIKHELTNAAVLIISYFELPFKLYIVAAFTQGFGAVLHQRQILDGEPRAWIICYISRKLKDSEARYGATQTEDLFLLWALEKLHYDLEGAVFEVYTDFTPKRDKAKLIVMANAAYDPEVAAKIPISFMEIDRRKNLKFSKWAANLVPQTVMKLNQKEQKLPYWE